MLRFSKFTLIALKRLLVTEKCDCLLQKNAPCPPDRTKDAAGNITNEIAEQTGQQ